MAITAFLSRSPRLLRRGPGGPTSLGHVPHSSIFSPTHWTSCAPSYIIIWRALFFLRASQFRTQFNPSTVKVISWYSSSGCTCYLHWCISYFDSLARVNMFLYYYYYSNFPFTIAFFSFFTGFYPRPCLREVSDNLLSANLYFLQIYWMMFFGHIDSVILYEGCSSATLIVSSYMKCNFLHFI